MTVIFCLNHKTSGQIVTCHYDRNKVMSGKFCDLMGRLWWYIAEWVVFITVHGFFTIVGNNLIINSSLWNCNFKCNISRSASFFTLHLGLNYKMSQFFLLYREFQQEKSEPCRTFVSSHQSWECSQRARLDFKATNYSARCCCVRKVS